MLGVGTSAPTLRGKYRWALAPEESGRRRPHFYKMSFYRRELLGGGEGGANTCKTSSCFAATAKLMVSAGAAISTGCDNTYTPLFTTTDASSSWQQDMLQAAMPVARECSHSAPVFAGEFVFACPCAAHIFPAQHAIPCSIHADAHIGVHNSNTAIRHTHAPTVLPGAIGAWSERLITLSLENT